MTQRQQFEEWAKKHLPQQLLYQWNNKTQQYSGLATNAAWITWRHLTR